MKINEVGETYTPIGVEPLVLTDKSPSSCKETAKVPTDIPTTSGTLMIAVTATGGSPGTPPPPLSDW